MSKEDNTTAIEIEPEATEVEVYPTEARLQQKAKEMDILSKTGVKHQPAKRSKKIEVGADDCGEDFKSIDSMIQDTDAHTIVYPKICNKLN